MFVAYYVARITSILVCLGRENVAIDCYFHSWNHQALRNIVGNAKSLLDSRYRGIFKELFDNILVNYIVL